jgi:hypothetical protein
MRIGTGASWWWSRQCSNLLLPGFNRPLHRQSLRTLARPGERGGRDGAGGGDRTRSLSGTGRAPCQPGLAGMGECVGGTSPLNDDHQMDDWEMDAREGLSPPCRGLQPRALILGHRAGRCQGGGRTLVFRVTAGRPCLWTTWHRLRTATGSRTPASGSRTRRHDRLTIAASSARRVRRGEFGAAGGRGSGATRTPKGRPDPYLFSRQAPDPAGSLPQLWRGDSNPRGRHPYPPSKRAPHPVGSPPRGPRWGSHPQPRRYQRRALLHELRGHASRRHDSNVRRPPSEGGALIR